MKRLLLALLFLGVSMGPVARADQLFVYASFDVETYVIYDIAPRWSASGNARWGLPGGGYSQPAGTYVNIIVLNTTYGTEVVRANRAEPSNVGGIDLCGDATWENC